MGTLMDKLNATNATKEQIRQAIERKKVSVPENTPLKDYPAKIDGIYPDALFMQDCKFGDGAKTLDNNQEPIRIYCFKVVYGKGIYIGYDLFSEPYNYKYSEGVLIKSSNNADWEYVPIYNAKFRKIVFYKDVFVGLCSYANTVLQYSTDGRKWTYCNVVGTDTAQYSNAPLFYDEKHIYTTGNPTNDGKLELLRSADGKTFSVVNPNPLPSNSNEISSAFYSKRTKKYYVSYNDYNCYVGETLSGLKIRSDINGNFLEVGNHIYVNRNYNEVYVCWYENDKGDFINIMEDDSSNNTKDINVINYLNGNYFGYKYSSTNKYRMFYSNNGINGWREIEKENYGPQKEWIYPFWNVLNGIAFNLVIANSYNGINGFMFKRGYSFDGFTWFKEIHSTFVDVNGNNVTNKVIGDFVGPYSQDMLQAAYEAGVNSI